MAGKRETEMIATTAKSQQQRDRIGPTLNGDEEDKVGVLSADRRINHGQKANRIGRTMGAG